MLSREQKEMIWIAATSAAVLFLVILGNMNLTLPNWSWSFGGSESAALIDVQSVSVPEALKWIRPVNIESVVVPNSAEEIETVKNLALAEDLAAPAAPGTSGADAAEISPDIMQRWLLAQEFARDLNLTAPAVPGTSGADAAGISPDIMQRWLLAQEFARDLNLTAPAVPEYVYLLERLGASDWLPRDPSIIWVEATAAPTTSSEPTSRVRYWLPAAMRGEATAKWTTLPVDELSLVP